MGLFDWLKGKKPSSLERQADLARRAGSAPGQAAGKAKASRPSRKKARPGPYPSVGRSRTTRNLVHLDATFDGDEHAAFLLGIKVACRSSWVDAARWNEETSTLTLAIDGKDYDFPGIDFEGAEAFSRRASKGRWYWEVWKGRGVAHGEAFDVVRMGGREPGRR